jgi:hypothetical protein
MRNLVTAVSMVAALAGCSGARQNVGTDLPASAAGRLRTFDIDACYSYVVDPAVDGCFLLFDCLNAGAMVAVDCAKLAARVPETASAITWVGAAAPATPAVDVPAPPAPRP